ncbi:MAG: tetratricopeptide repeat protein [Oscillospiraceae bacterium]|nr:tetratricopeptide repeat protein [Oscillospiraceae bacterium]
MNQQTPSPAEQDALARDTLQWIMDSAEDGFYLLIAPLKLQRVEAERYAESAAVYDYDNTRRPEDYIGRPFSFGELARWADGQTRNKLFVLNVQAVLQTENDFLNLNLSRDMLARMGKVWVFGATALMDDKLARTAMDFYAYVRLQAKFPEQPEALTIGARFPESRLFNSSEEARRMIATYGELEERLLAEDTEGLEDKQRLSIAATLENIAGAYFDCGQYDHALRLLERVRCIREKELGTEHPDTIKTYNKIGRNYYELGQHNEALRWYQKVFDILSS